ncbi:inositol monophosphatase family protein, partial [Micrococcus sp. F3Y]|uniref:inositol monophosphatase family protein n=1 Tax=Micrococcus sp. F3Y TaxID=3402627 RepID=UPI003AF76573
GLRPELLAEHAGAGAQAGTGEAARLTWIVDPIDGTSNFAHGFAMFSVSLAAEVDGEVVAGVVLDPVSRLAFSADGDGAYLTLGQRALRPVAAG